ncbi:MAG: hypothetical protein M3405_03350 [Acidobacteriota bacterium]|jgi:hypothetical protein|nr:hypothetical protein [Acidobacteriota bacterium]
MKIFLVTISILLLSANLFAQQKCELTLAEAPTLQNLSLGMSPTEARSILGIKVKADKEGQSTYFQNYIKKKAKGKLTGIRAIYLRFYDAKLYQIEFFYEQNYRWQNLENLLDDYSSNHNFPREFWLTEYGYADADCNGFSLDADYKLNPHIQLTNDGIAEIVEMERKEKEKENTN